MQDVYCNCVIAIYPVRKLPASYSCSFCFVFFLLRTTPMMIMKSWGQTWRRRESYLGSCQSKVQYCGILGRVFWVRVTEVSTYSRAFIFRIKIIIRAA